MIASGALAAATGFVLLASAPAAESRRGMTLEALTRQGILTVHRVAKGATLPLGRDDQTNNLAEGDKVLLLSGQGLTDLEGIGKMRVLDEGREVALTGVKRLQIFLNENELHNLPAEFFALPDVTFVYLNKNRFDAIPPGIARMTGLLGMYFTGNHIREIPPEVFTMTWLKKLQVSKNHLTVLPNEIGNLTRLMHLNLSGNQITALPDGIARLTKLRVCDFSGNRIKQLPEEFGKVPIMHQLRVCDNPLTSLPAGFAEMPGSIDITGTQIVPESLVPALRAKISREKHATKESLVKRL